MIRPFRGTTPAIAVSAYVDPSATHRRRHRRRAHQHLAQRILRGDVDHIRIGEETSIQDNTVLHCDAGDFPLTIGDRVTVGHSVMLHGCTVEDDALIGIGAIVLNGATIGKGAVVAAGALVPEGMEVPPRHAGHGRARQARRAGHAPKSRSASPKASSTTSNAPPFTGTKRR